MLDEDALNFIREENAKGMSENARSMAEISTRALEDFIRLINSAIVKVNRDFALRTLHIAIAGLVFTFGKNMDESYSILENAKKELIDVEKRMNNKE